MGGSRRAATVSVTICNCSFADSFIFGYTWQVRGIRIQSDMLNIPSTLAPIVWLVFTTFFFLMSWKERRASCKPLSSLRNMQTKGSSVKITSVDFQSFAQELNQANQESHRIASTAYLLAGVTALASFALSLSSPI